MADIHYFESARTPEVYQAEQEINARLDASGSRLSVRLALDLQTQGYPLNIRVEGADEDEISGEEDEFVRETVQEVLCERGLPLSHLNWYEGVDDSEELDEPPGGGDA